MFVGVIPESWQLGRDVKIPSETIGKHHEAKAPLQPVNRLAARPNTWVIQRFHGSEHDQSVDIVLLPETTDFF